MALKTSNGSENAIAVTAEIVACIAFVILQCVRGRKGTIAVIARGHQVSSSSCSPFDAQISSNGLSQCLKSQSPSLSSRKSSSNSRLPRVDKLLLSNERT